MFLPDAAAAANGFPAAGGSPGSPMRWDDLLDLSESAKDALSLALGPQKTIGPPGTDEDEEEDE